MQYFLIIDIDGTIASCDHRLHFISGASKDWDSFYAGVEGDPIIENVACVIRSLLSPSLPHNHYTPIFITGRPERCKEATIQWLSGFGLWRSDAVYLCRPDADHCPDVALKARHLDYVSKTYGVASHNTIIFEDRARVVDMYRSRGFTVFHVADGKY